MKNTVTYLFVPADKSTFLPKALHSGADAIIVDLEDAVRPVDKPHGRENVIRWLSATIDCPEACKIYIRINSLDSGYFSEDVKMLSSMKTEALSGLVLPKLESAETVQKIASRLPEGLSELPLVGIIETARGVHYCDEIAASGVAILAFGSLDYSLDTHCQQTLHALLYARSRIVIASRVAGLPPPIDCVTPEIVEQDTLRADALHARSLGFGAKLCIHPHQIPVVTQAFSPDAEALRWAERVVAQADEGYAFQVDGKMVDLPLIRQAERLLAERRQRTLSDDDSAPADR
ncbi:HpcH/HpaI aldolase/citrate lyase family protein [Budvicia diplopodorum]|uniref:HpcH/HpaI aldolase/citrate lyase family protein n=1 Tax=Budvicia diplopodorum TaxID=1119056 RepID=UPI00135A5127|nr:CoA ester lyase [Budvicia diplopodorum]